MAMPDVDPLRESIAQAAMLIDVDAVAGLPDSEDPMIRLLQQGVQSGLDAEEALTGVIDRVTAVGNQVLSVLDFPPRAITGSQLGRRMEEAGASDLEISAAVSSLGSRGKIDAINGWFFKKPEPIVMDGDDLDWFRGTGRYAQ